MVQNRFWVMQEDFATFVAMSRALGGDPTIGLANSGEMATAEHLLNRTHRWFSTADKVRQPGAVRAPPGFPRPFFSLPRKRFAPDFFEFGSYWLASRRLRDVLALPEHVVQYWPVELLAGTVEAEAQDYHWIRVLLAQYAMDWARSTYKMGTIRNYVTGRRILWSRGITRFVVRPDLRPTAELFRAVEVWGHGALVTDALAERVLRAGCTGVAFQDPRTAHIYQGIKLYRTADGVRERDTRPEATPPRRKQRRVSAAS